MQASYQLYLKNELANRCERNPNYSLRAFARSVGVDAGGLSRVLSGKQTLSVTTAKRILNHLSLTPNERHVFLSSVVEAQGQRKLERAEVAPELPVPTEIDAELFRTISELYHYTILELAETQGFDPDPKAISGKLGISPLQAQLAIDRLCRLGLLERVGKTYKKTSQNLAVRDKSLTTPALKNQQREILLRAIRALDEVPLERRANNSITMAIDPSLLPEAKKQIIDFTRNLCQRLETGKRTKVFQLSVNLFPLERE